MPGNYTSIKKRYYLKPRNKLLKRRYWIAYISDKLLSNLELFTNIYSKRIINYNKL